MIQRDNLRIREMTGNARAHVSRAGSNIQEGEVLLWMHQIPHDPKQRVVTAEPAVNPSDVAEIPVRRHRAGTLQQFRRQGSASPSRLAALPIESHSFSP
jgi:hypothetical protein